MKMTADVYRDDVLKYIYFITALQAQSSASMYGALSFKKDSMGGLFDRFINTITEYITLNKIILPCIEQGNCDIKIHRQTFLEVNNSNSQD